MMLSTLRGLNMLTGGGEGFDPDLEVIESLVNIISSMYEFRHLTI